MSSTNQELEELRAGIADVLEHECGSRKVHDFVDGKNRLDQDLWRKAGELGWFALGLPEDYGGLGLGVAGLGKLHHELGRRLTPGAYISTLTAGQWLAVHGDARQRQELLPRIAAGELMVAIPASPPEFRGSLGLSGGKLNGSARSLLGHVSAGLAIVPCHAEDGRDVWALVLLNGESARLSGEPVWDATRQLCTLECSGAAPEYVIAASDQSRATLALHLALAITCDSLGAAETILDQTIEYLKGRIAFDRPLASFQALKHRAANLAVSLETSRHLAAQALDAAIAGEADASMWVALAKASVTDACARIAEDCLQLHGGVGFTWEFDCHLFLKRTKLNQALAGSNERHFDSAAGGLSEAMRAGRSCAELPL